MVVVVVDGVLAPRWVWWNKKVERMWYTSAVFAFAVFLFFFLLRRLKTQACTSASAPAAAAAAA
jgi:hypothetical protein